MQAQEEKEDGEEGRSSQMRDECRRKGECRRMEKAGE